MSYDLGCRYEIYHYLVTIAILLEQGMINIICKVNVVEKYIEDCIKTIITID